MLTCDVCEGSFTPNDRRGPLPKRCSDACRREHTRRRIAAARAAGRVTPRAPRGPWKGTRTCRHCDGAFAARSPRALVCYAAACQSAKRTEQHRAFRNAHLERTGAPYVTRRDPENRAAHAATYRALRRGAEIVEAFTVSDLLTRDGWNCHLCDEEIPVVVQHPHVLSPTIDHVLPLSRGGAHSLANAKAAHYSCNARKRDRV